MRQMYLFTNENIALRKMRGDIADKKLVLKWLSNPEVLKYAWGEDAPWDMGKIEKHFTSKTSGEEEVTGCIIEYSGEAVGYLQFYAVAKDSYRFNEQVSYEDFSGAYGIDMFIGYPELWGKGIGSKTARAVADYLIEKLGAARVCADPEESNARSIRCWEKAGFVTAGKIPNYDDPQKNSLLMYTAKKAD